MHTNPALLCGQSPSFSSVEISDTIEEQRAKAEKQFDKILQTYSSLGNTKYVSLNLTLLQSEKVMFYKKWADYLEDQATNSKIRPPTLS